MSLTQRDSRWSRKNTMLNWKSYWVANQWNLLRKIHFLLKAHLMTKWVPPQLLANSVWKKMVFLSKKKIKKTITKRALANNSRRKWEKSQNKKMRPKRRKRKFSHQWFNLKRTRLRRRNKKLFQQRPKRRLRMSNLRRHHLSQKMLKWSMRRKPSKSRILHQSLRETT